MDKEQLRIRAERRRKFIQAQADAQDSLVAEIGRYWLSKATSQWDPANSSSIPEGVPVGPDFEKFVKDYMKANGYRTLEFGDGAIKAGAEAVAAWIDYNGAREVGRDYPNPLTEVDKDKGKGGYVVASIRKQADHIYGPVKEDRHRSMYGPPEEWARTCPEHAGVQMRRVSDGIYQCPMSGDTYSYTDGHNVEYHVGVHNQTNPNWNDTWPQPAFLTSPNQQSTRASGGTWEKIEAVPDLTNSVDADNEHLRVLPVYDGAEDDTTFVKETPELYRNSEVKGLMKKKANEEMSIVDNLFGKTTLHSRYCPDHVGVSLYRLADNVFQCPLDRAVYDYGKGFKTQDGTEHNGGSIAEMTPDWPEFYQAPHPFVAVQSASKVKGLMKTSADPMKGVHGPGRVKRDPGQTRSTGDSDEAALMEIQRMMMGQVSPDQAKQLLTLMKRLGPERAKELYHTIMQGGSESVDVMRGIMASSKDLTRTAFTNLEYRLARDLDRALRGDEEAVRVLGLISDGVFSKGKSFMEAARAAYDYVEMGGQQPETPTYDVGEEEIDPGYSMV